MGHRVLETKKEVAMWKFVSSITAISCFLMNCFHHKVIIYPEKIERRNYAIHRNAREVPNWPSYHKSITEYDKSDGSLFGPELQRYGGDFYCGNGLGIYLEIAPDNEYVLLLRSIYGKKEDAASGYVLVKTKILCQTIEFLIPDLDIRRVFPKGVYEVYGFKNEELILKSWYSVFDSPYQ